MKRSVVGHLILKDLRLQRTTMLISVAAGFVALALMQRGGEVPLVIGSVWFFVALVVLGSMLPVSSIVNERKKQSLAFLMSLPLSSIQYTTAKMISSLIMFLLPWLTLVAAALILIEKRSFLPHGAIPLLLILSLMPLVGFSLISGAALVGESEGWAIAASVICNSSYGLIWYLLARVPSLTTHWSGRVAIWNSTVLRILAIESGLTILLIGITFFLQSKKRDFT